MHHSLFVHLIPTAFLALIISYGPVQSSQGPEIFELEGERHKSSFAYSGPLQPVSQFSRPRTIPPLVFAQLSCRACGSRSRACHAPCKRMGRGPSKGSCHARCRAQLGACKRSCRRVAPIVRRKIDFSGQSKAKTVSAKRAKTIAIKTRGQVAAAVPPNIDDITAILRKQKPVNQKSARYLKREADRKPPATKSKSTLAKFYQTRADAAGKIGRTDQQLRDLTKARDYARAAGSKELLFRVLTDFGVTVASAGYYGHSVRGIKQSLKLASKIGGKIVKGSVLVIGYMTMGRPAAAKQQMAQVKKLLNQGAPQRAWQQYGDYWSAYAKYGQAAIFEGEGEYEKAANLYRSAISDMDRSLQQRSNPWAIRYGDITRQSLRERLSIMLEADGRIVEAELVIRRAILDRLKATGLNSTWTPRIIVRFADHLALQGRYDESRKLIEFAINLMKKLGFPPASTRMGKAQLLIARLEFLSGRPKTALTFFESMKVTRSFYARNVETDVDRLLTLALSGRNDELRLALQKSSKQRSIDTGGDRAAYGVVKQGALAIALAKSGDQKAAYAEFRRVIPKLISLSESQADEDYTLGTAREYRTSVILESYLALLADIRGTPLEAELGIDAAAEAFRIADEARSQLVQRAVSAASARATVKNKQLAELVRIEQDTRKRLTAQRSTLAGILATPTDQQDAKAVRTLRSNISKLQRALAALLADIKTKFPDYAALLNPQAPEIAEVQKALQPGEAFVSIYLGREKSYVWALPKEGKLAFHASSLTRAKASKLVAALRKALNPQVEALGDIPPFDVEIAHQLYQELLQPVETGWKSAKSLLVSTNGAIGQLPLSVLPSEARKAGDGGGPLFAGYRDVKWLARTHAVTVLPSAATLVTLRSLPKGSPDRKPFLAFGDPLFNATQARLQKDKKPKKASKALAARGGLRIRGLPIRLRATPTQGGTRKPDLSALPRLPDTAEEVRAIAIAMRSDPATSLHLRRAANEDTIGNLDLSGYKVIAFATHGLIPGDLPGIREPALALTAPGVAKSKGDGLLHMSEIMGLKLDADWVILSACNTGAGRGAGAEAISGLGRAFFYAGTRALLVSSWPVETVSARLLTTDVFERLTSSQHLHRAEALRQAMSALMDRAGMTDQKTGQPLFYYAHPIFWAPFILVGDGGRAMQ